MESRRNGPQQQTLAEEIQKETHTLKWIPVQFLKRWRPSAELRAALGIP